MRRGKGIEPYAQRSGLHLRSHSTLETVVFIGENLDAGDEGQVYFRDIRGVRYGDEGDGDFAGAPPPSVGS